MQSGPHYCTASLTTSYHPPPPHRPPAPRSSLRHINFTHPTKSRPMAKSLRSKVKRSFRSKKRETGVYAAADAARLNRLNSKLVKTTKGETEPSEPVGEDDIPGWCWFATFGLLDPNDITLDSLHDLSERPSKRSMRSSLPSWMDCDSS